LSASAPRAFILAGLLALTPPTWADCEAPRPQALIERFNPADCPACWRAAPPPLRGADNVPTLAIDWIVAGTRSGDATLAAAALPEGATRAARAGGIKSDEVLSTSHPLSTQSALTVRVADGAAWNNYIGISLAVGYEATRPLPEGIVAYVALVERVPACEEGTLVERRLVRSLVGPLTLAGLGPRRPVEHRLATRVPDIREPQRLSAVAWVEAPNGRVLAASASVNEGCASPLTVSTPRPPVCPPR